MRKHLAVLVASLTAASALAASSSTESPITTDAMITLNKNQGTYEVVVWVAQAVEKDGVVTHPVIAKPKVQGVFGTPATVYSGLQTTHKDYQQGINVTVNVFWPEAGKSGRGFWNVTVRRGDKVVAKSQMHMEVDGK